MLRPFLNKFKDGKYKNAEVHIQTLTVNDQNYQLVKDDPPSPKSKKNVRLLSLTGF